MNGPHYGLALWTRSKHPAHVLHHTPSQPRSSGFGKEPTMLFFCFATSRFHRFSGKVAQTVGCRWCNLAPGCCTQAFASERLSCTVTHFSSSSFVVNTLKLMLSPFPPALCCRSINKYADKIKSLQLFVGCQSLSGFLPVH